MNVRRLFRGWWLALPMVALIILAASGRIEAAASAGEPPGPFWVHLVERFFIVFTGGVIAFGIIQVELEVLNWAWLKIKGNEARYPAVEAEGQAPPAKKVPRFGFHVRVQHFILLTAFIVLAVTGISQKFYRSAPFDDFIALIGGLEALRLIHRSAGILLILDGLYHMAYVIPSAVSLRNGSAQVRSGPWLQIIPNFKDIVDFFELTGYYLGIRPNPPKFGHFSYLQKFDYWAVYWGMIVMATSGIIMLLPALGVEIASTPIIATALITHSDEAVLAASWIIVVHMYHAHLSPRVFPFNPTMFTGDISMEQLWEEHELEYDALAGNGAESSGVDPSAGNVRAEARNGAPSEIASNAETHEEREELLRAEIVGIRERYDPTTWQLLRFLGVGHSTLVRLLSGRHVTPRQMERMWTRIRGGTGSLTKKNRRA